MELTISTPSLLFSAISLLMLAYTNRFIAVANLVRQFVHMYDEKQDDNILRQLKNFQIRLKIIKFTQIFGVTSFIFCVISMLLIFLSHDFIAEIVFICSLVTMIISLSLSLQEVFLSIGALNIEMNRVEKLSKKHPKE